MTKHSLCVDHHGLTNLLDQKICIMRRNARQILDIVRGTFPKLSFDDTTNESDCISATSDGAILSCLWFKAASVNSSLSREKNGELLDNLTGVSYFLSSLLRVLNPVKFAKQAQIIMSSTASNYDINRLQTGIAIATLATIGSAVAASRNLLAARATSLWALSMTVTYCVTMFASSYIEEEHHFWYWTTSGWLAGLVMKQ